MKIEERIRQVDLAMDSATAMAIDVRRRRANERSIARSVYASLGIASNPRHRRELPSQTSSQEQQKEKLIHSELASIQTLVSSGLFFDCQNKLFGCQTSLFFDCHFH